MPKPLQIAVLGCGSRGRTYAGIIAASGGRYQLTAAADPVAERRAAVTALAADHGIEEFTGAEDLWSRGKLADVLIIATQDSQHFGHAMAALELGYDILLEKPAAESLARCDAIDRRAKELGRRVALCFVLRYTPFYTTVKRLIDEGEVGRVISLRTHEGVDPFHQAHSFVRGHWSKSSESTPMIVAKCSHDADLLCWLGGGEPEGVSSHGGRSWFRAENAPIGAPLRCTDGCPAAATCMYHTHRYLGDMRRWLGMVMDGWENADDGAVLEFLKTSRWGRCVYHCDNDVVDHQVVSGQLSNGVTVSHSMTAFDRGRTIEIFGTKASLRAGAPFVEAGGPELWLREHASGVLRAIPIPEADAGGYAGHGGGDHGLIAALEGLFRGENALPPGLDGFAGHRLAFLAEESRISGRTVMA